MEQFFWRIISSPRLQLSLSEAKIAYLHSVISQGSPIHTKPGTSVTHTSDVVKEINVSASQITTNSKRNAQPSSDPHRGDRDARATTAKSSEPGRRESSTSRSHLTPQKSKVETKNPSESARILTPTGNQEVKSRQTPKSGRKDVGEPSLRGRVADSPYALRRNTKSTLQDGATESQASGESRTSQSTGSSSKSGKKNSSFSVNSKKKRPVVSRRRSSQSASGSIGKSPKSTTSPSKDKINSVKLTRSQSCNQTDSQEKRELDTISENLDTKTTLARSKRSNSASQYGSDRSLGAASSLLNPQMRILSPKSSSATSITLTLPTTANLLPSTTSQGPLIEQEGESSADTLLRSRSNLNLLLQKDRQRASENARQRRA